MIPPSRKEKKKTTFTISFEHHPNQIIKFSITNIIMKLGVTCLQNWCNKIYKHQLCSILFKCVQPKSSNEGKKGINVECGRLMKDKWYKLYKKSICQKEK